MAINLPAASGVSSSPESEVQSGAGGRNGVYLPMTLWFSSSRPSAKRQRHRLARLIPSEHKLQTSVTIEVRCSQSRDGSTDAEGGVVKLN